MRIGIDILGGDYAPDAVLEGAVATLPLLRAEDRLVLIGPRPLAEERLIAMGCEPDRFEFVHTSEAILMGEHPAKAFQHKPNSSIALGFGLLREGAIDGFASAGNTGAMLVGCMYTIKSIPGVIRPAIAAPFPRIEGGTGILLDVGLNPDCKVDVLYQYAILGSLYASHVMGIESPRVGLINIGEEEEKGNLLAKAAYDLMKGSTDFNFAGNIEGNDLFSLSKSDVMVCDGFTGNILLKEAEALYSIVKSRKINDEFFEQFNFENFGGTPILGVNAPVIIAHGSSTSKAFKNMILHTKNVIEARLIEKFKQVFK